MHLNGTVLLLAELADTGAKDLGAHQSGDAAHHVNGAGAGKIVEAQLSQPAAAPDPVRLDGIDQGRDDAGVDAVTQEFGTLCHSAGDDGRRSGAEDQIEYEVGPVEAPIGCEDIKAGLADQADQILTQQEAEADENEDHCTDTEVHQVLHDDVTCIFGAGKASFHHGKAGLHPEDQRSAD